jgi:hypothetical protein
MKKIEVLCDIDHSNNNIMLETLVKRNIRGVHNTVLQEVFLSEARNARVCCASAASFILSSF